MIKGKKETDFAPIDAPEFIPGQLGNPPTKKPCQECPLRKASLPGYLGGYTVEQYLEVLHSDAQIACHLSPGFAADDHATQRHCTGVAAYRANVHKLPRGGGSREAVELVGPRDDCFQSPREFAEHHKAASDSYRAAVEALARERRGK